MDNDKEFKRLNDGYNYTREMMQRKTDDVNNVELQVCSQLMLLGTVIFTALGLFAVSDGYQLYHWSVKIPAVIATGSVCFAILFGIIYYFQIMAFQTRSARNYQKINKAYAEAYASFPTPSQVDPSDYAHIVQSETKQEMSTLIVKIQVILTCISLFAGFVAILCLSV